MFVSVYTPHTMPSRARLLAEAVVVGIVFALCYATVAFLYYHVWLRTHSPPQTGSTIALCIVAGCLGHTAFEVTGFNKWYVDHYSA